MWSPGGQLPYEYTKKKKEEKKGTYMGVACIFLTKPPPPPLSCWINLKPGQCRGQSASLALPSFGYRQGF